MGADRVSGCPPADKLPPGHDPLMARQLVQPSPWGCSGTLVQVASHRTRSVHVPG